MDLQRPGRGIAEAKKTGKPLLVVLRCIPCEECVKLDDDLVNQDPRVRPLLEQFVCVRVVSTNGLDLSLFQFDYDQSFAAFLLNADGTIYGRFGTRSHRTDWSDDVSIDGLGQGAARARSELHAELSREQGDRWPASAGRRRSSPTPEKYPALKGKYRPEARLRGQGGAKLHPLPPDRRRPAADRTATQASRCRRSSCSPTRTRRSLGLILDPKERAHGARVETGFARGPAGFRKGRRDPDARRAAAAVDRRRAMGAAPDAPAGAA